MNIENMLSDKVKSIQPSGIRKFFDILDEMKDVVSLTVGQPDFVTPWHIREAAIESLEKGRTYYTSNAGLTPLREEIVAYMQRRFDLTYSASDEVLVTVGGSEAIDLAIRATVNPGDEVIIPQPSFVCYEPIVRLAGGIPVPIELTSDNSFVLTPEQIEAKVTDKTKAIILPYPGNPTGAIMKREDLERIAPIIEKHNLFVISDEIYHGLALSTSDNTLRDEYKRLEEEYMQCCIHHPPYTLKYYFRQTKTLINEGNYQAAIEILTEQMKSDNISYIGRAELNY